MRRFTDSTGRAWRLRLNVDALGRIRTLAGVDLLDSAGRDFAALLYHPAAFAAALFAAVEPDAYARDVAEGQFLDAMDPPACEQALTAFLDELSDFFPPPRTKAAKQQPPKAFDAWQSLRRLAGVAGVAPGPHTLRELIDMADGRNRSEWRRTAQVLTLLNNAHFVEKRSPEDFYPYSDESSAPPLKISMLMLKPVFVPGAAAEVPAQ